MEIVVGAKDTALLTSWKEIAQHMGKGVRTVQRWEQEFGLPVRRPANGSVQKSTVIARAVDLDAWVKIRWLPRAEKADPNVYEIAANRSSLTRHIQTSHELLAAHSVLVQEFSSALKSLISNCDRLARPMEIADAKPTE